MADRIFAYQELIRNGFLQASDLRERLASLYKTHFQHQVLAKSVAAELDGHDWDPEEPPGGGVWEGALYHCKHPLVHSAMYYQHRAKLDILKGAVEFALLQKHGGLPPERKIEFLGLEVAANFLPANFHSTVERLQMISGFEKAPVLWQSFLWKWGGFFLTDKQDEEISELAQESGLTTQSANAMLELFDLLFPIPGGWFYEGQGTSMLKLFPCQFRGVGVHLRQRRAKVDNVRDLVDTMPYQYLAPNLARWKNAMIDMLNFGK